MLRAAVGRTERTVHVTVGRHYVAPTILNATLQRADADAGGGVCCWRQGHHHGGDDASFQKSSFAHKSAPSSCSPHARKTAWVRMRSGNLAHTHVWVTAAQQVRREAKTRVWRIALFRARAHG